MVAAKDGDVMGFGMQVRGERFGASSRHHDVAHGGKEEKTLRFQVDSDGVVVAL